MAENFTAFLAAHQWVFVLAAVWSIPWKGVALWRAARNRSVAWFVVLLVVNTLGILDIIYIFAFSQKTGIEEAPEPIAAPEPEKTVLDMKKEGKMGKKQKVAEDEKREREEKKSDLDEEIQKG